MFSLGCCGNVLKQVIDMSNVIIDVSIDISNSSILERDVDLIIPLLDISNEQIHVIDAMNVFLNENKEIVQKNVDIIQEKLDIIQENVDIIQENVVKERDRSNTVIIS